MMGIFGIPMLLGPALGPVISGWLLEFASWPWIFLINVPVGIVAVIIGLRSLPSFAAENSDAPLDTIGLVLGPLAFSSLTYGISQSTEHGWTGTADGRWHHRRAWWRCRRSSRRELTTPHPLIELRVFKSRDFSVAIADPVADDRRHVRDVLRDPGLSPAGARLLAVHDRADHAAERPGGCLHHADCWPAV